MSLLLDALKLEAEQKARDAAAEEFAAIADDLPETKAEDLNSELSPDFLSLPTSANDSDSQQADAPLQDLPDLSVFELDEALSTLEPLSTEPTDQETVATPSVASESEPATATDDILDDLPSFIETPITPASLDVETTVSDLTIAEPETIEESATPEHSETEWLSDENITFTADSNDKPETVVAKNNGSDNTQLLEQIVQQTNIDCNDILAQLDSKNRQRKQLLLASIACGLVALAWIYSTIWISPNQNSTYPSMAQLNQPQNIRSTEALTLIDLATTIPLRKSIRVRRQATTGLSDAVTSETPKQRLEISSRDADTSHLESAHKALKNGETDKAMQLYQRALRDNSHSIDALNGLANIAMQSKDTAAARNYLLRSLQLAPDNSYAVSTLAALLQQNDKSTLANLAEQYPKSGAIQYQLGNAMAAEQQWLKAQEAYFKALSSAPKNALYAFNLAVALDHLGKTTVAKRYYQQALSMDNAAALNRAAIEQRIKQMESL